MDMIQDATRIVQQESQRKAPAPHSAPAASSATAAQLPPGREYLSFRLGAEEYGIDILKVQEIRSYEAPTRIANAPAFLRGVINLRGVIVPIVDLRVRLGCSDAQYNHFTVVIVLNVKGRVVGAVVDSVSDVLELPAEAIRPAPPMASHGADNGYLTGIGSVGEVATLEAQVEHQRRENGGLHERNAALAAEVRDLKEGVAAVEERARSELGMIRPGEVFYRVVEDPVQRTAPAAQAPAASAEAGAASHAGPP